MNSHSNIFEIKNKNLSELIAEEIQDLIAGGVLKPGEHIVEASIGQQFNVSRASVREAFRILEAYGFVYSTPRRGVTVAEISTQEAEQTFIIRADLESLATYFAIKKQDPAVLKELKTIYAEMEAVAAREDTRAYRELNQRFHEVYYSGSGNRLLANMVQNFIRQTRRYQVELFHTDDRLSRSLESHHSLIQFFEFNEPEKARDYRKKTLLKNSKILLKKIKRSLKQDVRVDDGVEDLKS